MSSLRSHGRTVVDAPTISSQASQRNVSALRSAPSNHRGRLLLSFTASPFCKVSSPRLPVEATPHSTGLASSSQVIFQQLDLSPFGFRPILSLPFARRRSFTISSGAAFRNLRSEELRLASTHASARSLEHIRNFTVTTTPCW